MSWGRGQCGRGQCVYFMELGGRGLRGGGGALDFLFWREGGLVVGGVRLRGGA